MQGALVSVYGEEAREEASDAVLWLSALDPEEAMAALRAAGVLDVDKGALLFAQGR